jgi:glycosyltransferase involved in cell wall biosynthesis
MTYRLAFLTSHVIQYQDPLFRRLAAHPDIDLTVLFCSRNGAERYFDSDLGVELSWDLEMLHGYRYSFLRNVSPKQRGGFWSRVNPGVVPALIRGAYDGVIVMGWGSPTAWVAFITCRALGTPFYLNGDNSFVEDPPTIRGRLRKTMLHWLFARAAGLLTMGTMNGDFYRYFGADARRFFLVPYAIDNERFFRDSRVSPDERAGFRLEMGLEADAVIVLFSGKLISKKRPLHVIQALENMRLGDKAAVVFMGDGEQRCMLESYAAERGLRQVRFLGFVNQVQMPKIYGASDVLILPSSNDPRGTVVNEAMACGLPVVISERVGVWGEGDIVRHGENGFVVPVDDVERIAQVLDDLVGDESLRAQMGARSLEIIRTWDYERDVEGILAALRATGRVSAKRLQPSQQTG